MYGRPSPAALCSERDVMRRAVTRHTDGSLTISGGPRGLVDIPKVDEAVIWRLVCEQNAGSGGAVT